MRRKILSLSFLVTLISIFIGSIYNNGHSNSSGAPNGFTGSPGDAGNTCAVSGCHSGFAVGTKTNVFTSNIPSDGYVPGTTYTITATVRSSPSRNTFGFQISPQTNAGALVGTLINTSAATKLTGAGKYLTHTSSGTTGSGGVKSWSFNWVAPAAGTGNVTFYGAFNHANGNGGTSGDSIFKSTYVISEKVAAPIVNLGGPNATICFGSSKVLDAGNPGSTYLWTKDNVQIATTRTVTATQAGKYKVVVTNQGGASAADSIQISIAPNITIGLPDVNICVGSSTTLDAGNPGATYLWSTGETTQSIQVTNPGSYSVKVTNSIGCEARDTATVTTIPLPIVNLGADKSACSGNPVLLDAGIAGAKYLWNTGDTTQSILVQATGNYSVMVTQNSCSASDTIQVNFNALPNANFTSQITPGLLVLFEAIQKTDLTYLWDFGDPNSASNSSTSFNPVHEFTAPGIYYIKLDVTDVNTGCVNSNLDTLEVLPIGINSASINQSLNLTISPNPFSKNADISYTLVEPAASVTMDVIDELGRIVVTLMNGVPQQAGNHKVNFQNEAGLNTSGIYFLRLHADGKTTIIKIIESR